MPKKRASGKDAGSAKPKQLRKRLRKAEDQLQDAQTKRDRAQARVEALSIIADEIRAQLAELEKREQQVEAARAGSDDEPASAKQATKQNATNQQAPTAGQAPATARKKVSGRKRATATAPVAAKKAGSGKDGASRKPSVAKKTAAAASPSATATARKTAGSTARKSPNGAGPASG
jgi:hypothetical protein